MTDNNPLNNTLALKLNSLESRLASLERARQPYVADWIAVTEPLTSNDTNQTVTFTSSRYIALDHIGIGDKIRFIQNGVTQYLYVVSITGNTLSLYGGSQYFVSNPLLPISEFYFSKTVSPNGFPLWMRRTYSSPNLLVKNASGTGITVGSCLIDIKMVGDIMYVAPQCAFNNLAAATAFLQFQQPIPNCTLTTIGIQNIPGGSSEKVPYMMSDGNKLGGGISGYTALERVDQTNVVSFAAFQFEGLFLYRAS